MILTCKLYNFSCAQIKVTHTLRSSVKLNTTSRQSKFLIETHDWNHSWIKEKNIIIFRPIGLCISLHKKKTIFGVFTFFGFFKHSLHNLLICVECFYMHRIKLVKKCRHIQNQTSKSKLPSNIIHFWEDQK